MRLLRLVAFLYSFVFGGVTLWAWASYLANLNSPREHLLPSVALDLIGMPSSLILERLATWFPTFLSGSLLVMSVMSFCALLQVVMVWCVYYVFSKKENRRRK
jgi:hypothetical protein